MKRIALSFIIMLIVVGVPMSGVAADGPSTLASIVNSGTFRVGMSGTQPPFTVVSKSGTLIGYEVELAKMLANAMGVKLELVQKPFAELLPALEAGEIDAIMSGMTMTPKRNLRVAFVGPYIVSGKSILTKAATLEALDEVDDIDRASVKLVALKGSTSQKYAEQVLPEAQLTLVDNYDAGVQMVLDGKVGAMLADFPICALSVLRYPEANLATLVQPLTIEPIGIALPPGDPLLLNMVENYLGALEGTGLLELLEKRWFEDGSWLVQLP